MALWNYCAICGKRIEVGDPCLGIEKKNAEIAGDSICFDCVKIENINGLDKTVSITDLLARAEAAEALAEKAERERDAAIEEIPKICYYCKHRKGWKVCEDWNGNQEAETCEKWEWRGQKEE